MVSLIRRVLFSKKTLLVVDLPGFSLFYKTAADRPFSDGYPVDQPPFQAEVPQLEFSNLNAVGLFQKLFCQAVFLACNSPVHLISGGWWFLAEDKSLSPHMSTLNMRTVNMRDVWSLIESTAEVGEAKIKEAKSLYHILVELDSANRGGNFRSNGKRNLRIAIDRWLRSYRDDDMVDKMIDLGIAFEALYVPDGGSGEITFKLKVRAAWYLGRNSNDRRRLLLKFRDIYEARSTAVHTGCLDGPVKFAGDELSASEFIREVQKLCHDSIMKVLNDKCLPDGNYWNNLILGGE